MRQEVCYVAGSSVEKAVVAYFKVQLDNILAYSKTKKTSGQPTFPPKFKQ
jgi:hypothetical protein